MTKPYTVTKNLKLRSSDDFMHWNLRIYALLYLEKQAPIFKDISEEGNVTIHHSYKESMVK